jgi:hypothetical protein
VGPQACCAATGAPQLRSVEVELRRACPALEGRFAPLPAAPAADAPPAPDAFLLVYLTDGVRRRPAHSTAPDPGPECLSSFHNAV